MSKNLLIACTMRRDLHPALRATCRALLKQMRQCRPSLDRFEMETAVRIDDPQPAPDDAGRFWQQARARNALLAEHLKPHHDLVLWVDADLVVYPASLPAELHDANPGGVTAPMVLIQGTARFYDTLGFVQEGQVALANEPYFFSANGSRLVELDSVGCVYLIPADILRQTPYASLPPRPDDHQSIFRAGGHTDHWPVMQAAKRAGLRVAALRTAVAYHANLPLYGEPWH